MDPRSKYAELVEWLKLRGWEIVAYHEDDLHWRFEGYRWTHERLSDELV